MRGEVGMAGCVAQGDGSLHGAIWPLHGSGSGCLSPSVRGTVWRLPHDGGPK